MLEFRFNHHLHWGKLYKADEVTVRAFLPTLLKPLNHLVPQLLWHVPNDEEIALALQVFQDIVEPAMEKLEQLLAPGTVLRPPHQLYPNHLTTPGIVRDSAWRNDFCRSVFEFLHSMALDMELRTAI